MRPAAFNAFGGILHLGRHLARPVAFNAFERHIQSHIDQKVISRHKAQDEYRSMTHEHGFDPLHKEKKTSVTFGSKSERHQAGLGTTVRRSQSLDDATISKLATSKLPWMIAAERYSHDDAIVGTNGDTLAGAAPSASSSSGNKRKSHYEVDAGPPNPYNMSKYAGNVRSTTKFCNSFTATILTPIALLIRERYEY